MRGFASNGPKVPAALRLPAAVLLLIASALPGAQTSAAESEQGLPVQFLAKYCMECHDKKVQKGDREFESFALPLKSEADLITAKDVIDQIVLKEMPPKKAPQPNDAERLAVLKLLRDASTAARGKITSSGASTVMRRLSLREYETTLSALFGRRVDTLGLTADFPKEKTSGHMDTIGQTLVTSGFLVDQYFQAANRLVEMRLGTPPMEPAQWTFNGNFRQYEELEGSHKAAFNSRTPIPAKAGTATLRISKRAYPPPAFMNWRLRRRRCTATHTTIPRSSESISPSLFSSEWSRAM